MHRIGHLSRLERSIRGRVHRARSLTRKRPMVTRFRLAASREEACRALGHGLHCPTATLVGTAWPFQDNLNSGAFYRIVGIPMAIVSLVSIIA